MAKTLTSFQDFSKGWVSSTQSTSHSSWPTVSVWISPSCWCSFPKSAITTCYQLAGSNRALVPHSSRLGNSGTMLRMGSCPSYSRTSSGLFQLLEFASNSRIPGLGAVSFSSWPPQAQSNLCLCLCLHVLFNLYLLPFCQDTGTLFNYFLFFISWRQDVLINFLI